MTRSLAVAAYLGFATVAMGVARNIVSRRLAEGKEDPERVEERFGKASRDRPEGVLVWFHAASVGEALSLLDLIEKFLARHPKAHVLVTTVTRTSAEILDQRLPERAFHQFAPVDAMPAVKAFLDHWQPDIAIWTESEFWPALMHRTKIRGTPMLLVNGRISDRTFRRMKWLGSFAASLLDRFDWIMVQNDQIANQFYRLGADAGRIEVTGSLKDVATPLPCDMDELEILRKSMKGRPVWLAASTHPGEEALVSDAHRIARRTMHSLVLIIAPRHPERSRGIAMLLRDQGWQVAIRSKGEKIARDTEIYLADTIGEMGLWYRLAAISFIGGSLVPVGGHNPFEPAALGSAIMHGPHVENFRTAYDRFEEGYAAVTVNSAEDLGAKLAETLPPDRTAALAAKAWQVLSEGADVGEHVLETIERYLPR
jgi:3-deoxy-D-manno-octulosonic-acid transferase